MRFCGALVFVCACLVLGNGDVFAQSSKQATSAIILGYSPRPPSSGYTSYLRSVRVRAGEEGELTLYVQYMGEDQFFPAVRTRCTIQYSDQPLHGIVGGAAGRDTDPHTPSVKAFSCKGVQADPIF